MYSAESRFLEALHVCSNTSEREGRVEILVWLYEQLQQQREGETNKGRLATISSPENERESGNKRTKPNFPSSAETFLSFLVCS